MSSSRSSRLHSVLVNSAPSSSCLNSQTIACSAVVDEHLPQRLRAVQQPLAQQAELLLEHLERLGVLELLDLVLRRLERAGWLAGSARDRALAAPQARSRARSSSVLMDDLRVTVGGDARDLRLELRRDLDARERAGDQVADLLGLAVDDDPGLLEQLRKLLVAGLAVGALGDVLFGERRPPRRWPSPPTGAARGRPPPRAPAPSAKERPPAGGALDEAASSDIARAIESIEVSRASTASL